MERLIEIGKIKAKAAAEIQFSKLGIGFEKLDRDVFNPEKAYDKVAAIGVKWVRLQSGWARTEKVKGVYDFAWLDSIVDNMVSRGLQPWLCLCYGNGLYTESANQYFGAVGCPPIFTEEEKTAWADYVKATVSHFRDRITWYEVWNEPDGKWCWKHGANAEEYGQFVVDTARAVRSAFPEAKVIGGVICLREISYLNTALRVGMAQAVDAVSFHEYTAAEHKVFERVAVLRALCRHYNPSIEIIQGESGSQSRSDGAGALKGGSWTPLKQAKQLARHTIADLISEVTFTSYFTTVDMIEALNGLVGEKSSYLDYGYFGVLGADFDENGFSTGEYTPKPSYYALQTICSIFAETVDVVDLPVIRLPRESKRIFAQDCDDASIISAGFRKPSGACAFAYWNSTNLMTSTFESTITLQTATLSDDIRLVDSLSGTVYRLPESILEPQKDGCILLKNLPITDYPLILTFGDFI